MTLAIPQALSQTIGANAGTEVPLVQVNDREHARSSDLPNRKKTDEPLIFGQVRDGVYTVDGMTAKVQMNYDMNGVRFVYLFVPGVGTAVLSSSRPATPDGSPVTLEEDELSFDVAGHHFRLTGVTLFGGRGKRLDHLFARLDREAWKLARQPMFGFGSTGEAPYVWPGALRPNTRQPAEEANELAPPVPAGMLPRLQTMTSAAQRSPVVRPANVGQGTNP